MLLLLFAWFFLECLPVQAMEEDEREREVKKILFNHVYAHFVFPDPHKHQKENETPPAKKPKTMTVVDVVSVQGTHPQKK